MKAAAFAQKEAYLFLLARGAVEPLANTVSQLFVFPQFGQTAVDLLKMHGQFENFYQVESPAGSKPNT